MVVRAPRLSRWFRAALPTWLLLLTVLLCGTTRAEPPRDVLAPERALTVPPTPKDFLVDDVLGVSWQYHRSSASIVRELQDELPRALRTIQRELGSAASDGLVIRLARSPEEMVALAPVDAPPPAYAVGVAYPARGLILLSVVSPESWLPPDLPRVLTHELSHVSLYRATGGKRLPLWFVEGLAIHQAGEQNLARVRSLWEAAVVGEVMPLAELSSRFPRRAHEVNRAYAQSADLVEHILSSDESRRGLSELVAQVKDGKRFEDAVAQAFRTDLASLDYTWRQRLSERFRILPLVLTGTALWGGIAVLAVLAFLRRRKQHHEKLRRWGDEEAAYERALAAVDLQRQMNLREELAMRQGLPLVLPLPREPGIPTVEHDGQRHTLH